MRTPTIAIAAIGVVMITVGASADTFTLDPSTASATITGSSGGLSASAEFSLSGGTLTVVLTNTGQTVSQTADVLTVLFWNSSTTLAGSSALLTSGSHLVDSNDIANDPAAGDVGNGWAYASGFSGPGLSNQGLSAEGLGIFGVTNLCSTAGCANIFADGPGYGIVHGFNGPSAAVSSNIPYVNNSVTFTLMGAGSSITLDNISFQYGTSLLDFPNIPGVLGSISGVPEPSSVALLAIVIGGLGFRAWRGGRAAAPLGNCLSANSTSSFRLRSWE